MFIFHSKFDNPPHRDLNREKGGTSKKFNGTSKFLSLDFLDLKDNGSPVSTILTTISY